MSHIGPMDDLALAVLAQNNLLLALIRTHPHRDILATTFRQAQAQFPESQRLSTAHPDEFKLASSIIKSFEVAFVAPLDPTLGNGA